MEGTHRTHLFVKPRYSLERLRERVPHESAGAYILQGASLFCAPLQIARTSVLRVNGKRGKLLRASHLQV